MGFSIFASIDAAIFDMICFFFSLAFHKKDVVILDHS